MSTPLFKIQVEQFFRRVGAGSIAVTLGNPSTFSPTPTNVTIDQVYDYFYVAGQALFTALDRYTRNEIYRHVPNLIKELDLTLTAGKVASPADVERIIEPVQVEVSTNVWKAAYNIPHGILDIVRSSTPSIRKISSDYPGFYTVAGDIYVLPTTATKVKGRYVGSVPRIVLSDQSSVKDIFPGNFTPHLIDGAVMVFKGDYNEISLEQFYYQKITNNFKVFANPILAQNNPMIEQQ